MSETVKVLFETTAPVALGKIKIGGKEYEIKSPRMKNFAAYLSAAKRLESEGEAERFSGVVDVLVAGVPGLEREVIEDLELDDGLTLVKLVTEAINKRLEQKEKANLGNPTSGTSSPSPASGGSPSEILPSSSPAT